MPKILVQRNQTSNLSINKKIKNHIRLLVFGFIQAIENGTHGTEYA